MSSSPLEYAPTSQLPWHRRRGTHRGLIFVALLAALGGGAWVGPSLWRKASDYLLLRRCLSFVAPAGQVAFESDPALAQAIVAADGRYRNELDSMVGVSPVASFAPPDWTALMRRLGAGANNVHAAPPLVLMHERLAPGGQPRLLLLRYSGTAGSEGGPTTHAFTADVLDPGGKLEASGVWICSSTMLVVSHPFSRLYCAVVDPADASHFSFRYETEDGGGTIDGWLKGDHELKLECRDGPEKVQ